MPPVTPARPARACSLHMVRGLASTACIPYGTYLTMRSRKAVFRRSADHEHQMRSTAFLRNPNIGLQACKPASLQALRFGKPDVVGACSRGRQRTQAPDGRGGYKGRHDPVRALEPARWCADCADSVWVSHRPTDVCRGTYLLHHTHRQLLDYQSSPARHLRGRL